jgi:hypothetical protein
VRSAPPLPSTRETLFDDAAMCATVQAACPLRRR